MSERPRALPGLVAELTAAVPKRLVKKLDQSPGLAEAWAWSASGDGMTVTTDGGETVTLRAPDGVLRDLAGARCSCLLSPRCLHLLAVVSRLEPADAEEPPPTDAAAPPETVVLPGAQRRAATHAFRAGAELLATGASGAGAVVQSELLRAVHGCRAAGLHRAAAAGLRVVRHVRDLRDAKPELNLRALASDLRELLETSHLLAGDAATPDRVGTARRRYDELGSLRLHGLFTEPVITASGFAGVVTWLVSADGRLFTVADVKPGEPPRARAAYGGPAGLGDATLSHRELGQNGLFLSEATASADGRLGAGGGVRAVAAGPSSLDEPPLCALFAPLAEQLDRAFGGGERRPGDDLLFVEGDVAGTDGEALVLVAANSVTPPEAGLPNTAKGELGPRPLRLVAPSDHAELAYRDTLRLLARAPGLRLRVIGRIRFDRPGTIAALAAALPFSSDAAVESPRLVLAAELGGRISLGLDALSRSHVTRADDRPRQVPPAEDATDDPLVPLRRRLHRMAIGGRSTLPPEVGAAVAREAAALRRRLMPAAAAVHADLAARAAGRARAATGALRKVDPLDVARAWLAAAAYERAATRRLHRASWR